jgi:hypothetical protein
MTNYSGVTAERWARFTKTQQLLQVALEMHRARQYLNATNLENLRVGYVRVPQLTDLTLQVQTNPGLLDELSRWRSVVVDLQRREAPEPETHELALLVLLQLDPGASEQIPYLFPPPA